MGGDELDGLVDPFGSRIFISQTKHPECNEEQSEEPAGKAATRACTDGADRGGRVTLLQKAETLKRLGSHLVAPEFVACVKDR